MRRATLISFTFHAAIAAAAIAAGMLNAAELPELDGGIPIALVAATPGTEHTGGPGAGSPERSTPAAHAVAAHAPPPQTPPPEVEPAKIPSPEPVLTQPEPKPEPPAQAVTPAEPDPPVEPVLVELKPVETDVTTEETASATTQATNPSTEGAAYSVQVAHTDTVAGGMPIEEGGGLGSSGVGTTADPAIVADYAALLAQWLDHHKEYPERARRRNQQGVVLCEFTVTDTGDVLNYRILEGSGYELLDEETDALIARASPLPPPPPGAASTYRVPIVFALR